MRTSAKRLSSLAILLVAALACSTIPRSPSQLKYPPLKFERPRPARHVLSNGMVVYLLENHELPLISANFAIRTGSLYEPEDKADLAQLTGTVMGTGGAGDRTGDQIDERLEFLAASIHTGISREEGSAGLSCLRKDFDEVLGILADVLRRPRFAEDKLDLAKKRVMEFIRRQNDSPNSIVGREWEKLICGSSPAWARTPTLESVKGITRDELVRFHEQYFHPNNIIAGFAGDFDSTRLLKRLEELFGDWPKREVTFPKIPPLADRNTPSVNYIYKDQPQSYIELGHLGIRRHNPDYYAVAVMNYIMGTGGFTSRLMSEVRSNRGLAYSVRGSLTDGTDRGRLLALVQTKSQSTREAISVMLNIIGRMATDPLSDDEMEKAKSSIKDGFVFRFERPEQCVSEQIQLEYYGYPADYLDTYIDKIMAVTKDDVHRVAKKYIYPDQMVILVVGDQARFEKPLDDFGKVNEIQLPKYE